jgi:hypothetical protein
VHLLFLGLVGSCFFAVGGLDRIGFLALQGGGEERGGGEREGEVRGHKKSRRKQINDRKMDRGEIDGSSLLLSFCPAPLSISRAHYALPGGGLAPL